MKWTVIYRPDASDELGRHLVVRTIGKQLPWQLISSTRNSPAIR